MNRIALWIITILSFLASGYSLLGLKQIALNANSLPSQVRVAYTGQSRPISSVRKELIKMWVETFGVKPDISGLLETELLFIQCNNEYWLPVQKQVIPHLVRK